MRRLCRRSRCDPLPSRSVRRSPAPSSRLPSRPLNAMAFRPAAPARVKVPRWAGSVHRR